MIFWWRPDEGQEITFQELNLFLTLNHSTFNTVNVNTHL